MSKAIGKLMYIGKSSKGDLINGKTYDCLDLSFGYVQILDESGELYWYSAKNPAGDQGKDHSVWNVIEDNSDGSLLTEFVLGNKSRTEKDKAEEQGKILASISIEMGGKNRIQSKKRLFVHMLKKRRSVRNSEKSN